MKTFSSRRHHYVAAISVCLTLSVVAVLAIGMVGCSDGGGIITYDLIVSSAAGGSVTDPGEGTYTYDEGTVVNLVATPDAGHRFDEWTGDVDTVADVNDATTTVTMNGDYSITANFVKTYDLNTSSTTGGSVTDPGEGTSTYDEGTVVDLAATPDAGYRFDEWTGDVGTVVDVNDPTTTVTMNGKYSITANFVKTYDLNTSSTAGGSVTDPGEGTHTYDEGTVINLVATPDAGCRFDEWTGDVGTVADVNDATTTVTMNGKYSITANFMKTYGLTTSSTAGGSVTDPGEGTHTYDEGTAVNLVAAPDAGHRFDEWTGDVSTVADVNGANTTIVMNGNYSITASFQYAPMVAAGAAHTAGLKDDGAVVAVGRNDYGQLNVGGWANIVQIAADYDHTLGLEGDGTVVAVGRNDYGQCNVGGWVDISHVSAGWFHTLGVKDDGTVVAAGWNLYGQCNVGSWTDIIQTEAGYYHTAGLTDDGTAVAVGRNNHGQSDVGGWANITQISAGALHTVGLKDDGTVVAVGNNDDGQLSVGNWTDIVQIAAGWYHTVGLKSDGTVVAVGRNDYGQCSMGGWATITQVAAGAAHTVGINSDGTVAAAGYNNYGQCDVDTWDLIP